MHVGCPCLWSSAVNASTTVPLPVPQEPVIVERIFIPQPSHHPGAREIEKRESGLTGPPSAPLSRMPWFRGAPREVSGLGRPAMTSVPSGRSSPGTPCTDFRLQSDAAGVRADDGGGIWSIRAHGARVLHLLLRRPREPVLGQLSRPRPATTPACRTSSSTAVLGGSRRFPVRDPFFEMVKMSMATFINAMTGLRLHLLPGRQQRATGPLQPGGGLLRRRLPPAADRGDVPAGGPPPGPRRSGRADRRADDQRASSTTR